jgi:methanogenesis multiheme c-type cytochrome
MKTLLTLAAISLVFASAAAAAGDIEQSYHGQLGLGTGSGMLEKWCALPNFSFEQDGGIDGWTSKSCNDCHIGAAWNPTKPSVDCQICHRSKRPHAGDKPAPEDCLTCHVKDTSKRGDLFAAETDVHAAAGMVCQDCHARTTDRRRKSDHQFLKGTVIDTTEETMEGTISCMICHTRRPHSKGKRGAKLDRHGLKVACETCHTGLRPGEALASRRWYEFKSTGEPITTKRSPGWLPVYKWYDGKGPGATGDYDLPILTYTERRGLQRARIHPFNAVTVDWYVKSAQSSFDDVIRVAEVKAADTNGDNLVTLDEMRAVYPGATLLTADMNFNVTHSVLPAKEALGCNDCHGAKGWVLDWKQLGYSGDPRRGK